MEISKSLIIGVGYLVILISLVPLVRKDHWAFRVCEYPRLQKLFINLLILVTLPLVFGVDNLSDQIICGLLVLNAGYLFYQVFPFTSLAKKQLLNVGKLQTDRQIGLFIGNVYQYNRKATEYLKTIKTKNPDVIMLVETDKWWASELESLQKKYPYQLLVPLENTYGMMLFSKFKLHDGKVKYLVEEGIPSVHTKIELPSGEMISFHGLHPTPPVPQENPRSTERDKEILLVGKEAKKSKLPVIVAGDLNDVAWSYTTDLFSKTSGLLDPRKGRGFFNTFHAKYFFLKFPLDHVFCSNDFTLVDIKRISNCGSDHHPMYIKLQYTPEAEAKQEEPEATVDEKQLASKKINKAT